VITTTTTESIEISDDELMQIIRKNEQSIIARAYRLGRKDLSLELKPVNKYFSKPLDNC
jgi:hypothetical protein